MAVVRAIVAMHRGSEDDRGGEVAAICRCLSLHTAASLWTQQKETAPEVVGYRYKAKPCRCRSWFCDKPSCLKTSARRLLSRLLPVLETFSGMLMLTLTVDPSRFESPLEAFEFLKKKRCVAELVKSLCKSGHLHSHRFFYVLEWQQNGMPHFHALVESNFIPFDVLAARWNRRVRGFGHVRISKSRFHSPLHAARYACKYLTKPPKDGYPQWVMEYRGQIKRFSTSRGLLPNRQKPRTARDRSPDHPRDCSCERCKERRSRRSTVANRVASCGQSTMLVREPLYVETDGELRVGRPAFVARAALPYSEARELADADDDSGAGFEVTLSGWEDFLRISERINRNEQAVAGGGRDQRERTLSDFPGPKTAGPGLPGIPKAAA